MFGELTLRHTLWEQPPAKWSFSSERRELQTREREELLIDAKRAWWSYQIVGEFVVAWWQIATAYCTLWLAFFCWHLRKALKGPTLSQA